MPDKLLLSGIILESEESAAFETMLLESSTDALFTASMEKSAAADSIASPLWTSTSVADAIGIANKRHMKTPIIINVFLFIFFSPYAFN